MKKTIALILMCVLLAGLLAGCGNSTSDNKKITLNFYYAGGGPRKEAIIKLTEKFNKTNGKNITVNATFMGGYGEVYDKLTKSLQLDHVDANLFLTNESKTRVLLDLKHQDGSPLIVPLQKYIDKENYDLSTFDKGPLGYYTVDGKLQAMPYYVSIPMLFINDDMVSAAGFDPSKPPKTWAELETWSKKISVPSKDPTKVVYGVSFDYFAWTIEEMFAEQNQCIVNNNNGRNGRADKILVDNEYGVNALKTIEQCMTAADGTKMAKESAESQKLLVSKMAAMVVQGSGAIGNAKQAIGDTFKWSVAPLPNYGNPQGGVIIGGAPIWMVAQKDPDVEQAEWEFVKFLLQPENQAIWFEATGCYVPNHATYDLPEVKKFIETNPAYGVAVEMMRSNPATDATAGALVGPFDKMRDEMDRAAQNVLWNNMDPMTALKTAAKNINEVMKTYNEKAK